MKLWQQLLQQVFSSRAFFASAEELRDLDLEDRGWIVIVSRSVSVFRELDLTNVPTNKHDQIISAQIPLLSPYTSPGYWYSIQGGKAKIWIWDEAALEALTEQNQLNLEDFEVLPEACMTTQRSGEIVICSSYAGCFAQVWHEDRLQLDSWWMAPPTETEWKSFLRGGGLREQAMPEMVDLRYERIASWVTRGVGAQLAKTLEKIFFRAMIVVFGIVFGFQLMGTLRLEFESNRLQTHVEEMSTDHQESIRYREKAFETRANVNRYQELRKISQIELLHLFTQALPESSEIGRAHV